MLVLGGTGMLGSMIVDVLSRCGDLRIFATAKNPRQAGESSKQIEGVDWLRLNLSPQDDVDAQIAAWPRVSWIINAIGVIKPYIHDDNPAEVEAAIRCNALFPHELAHAASRIGAKVIQIATDCVYSGAKGGYSETDKHDALDAYGKTKSLGEAFGPAVFNLRCSIIGPEFKSFLSLFEWFRRQPLQAKLSGFTNHDWNGVTTLQFAKVCRGIIAGAKQLPHLQHLVPQGKISKYELLKCFAEHLGRREIAIDPVQAPIKVDRTLATSNESLNRDLWETGGYNGRPPTVPEMVSEMIEFDYRFGDAR